MGLDPTATAGTPTDSPQQLGFPAHRVCLHGGSAMSSATIDPTDAGDKDELSGLRYGQLMGLMVRTVENEAEAESVRIRPEAGVHGCRVAGSVAPANAETAVGSDRRSHDPAECASSALDRSRARGGDGAQPLTTCLDSLQLRSAMSLREEDIITRHNPLGTHRRSPSSGACPGARREVHATLSGSGRCFRDRRHTIPEQAFPPRAQSRLTTRAAPARAAWWRSPRARASDPLVRSRRRAARSCQRPRRSRSAGRSAS